MVVSLALYFKINGTIINGSALGTPPKLVGLQIMEVYLFHRTVLFK